MLRKKELTIVFPAYCFNHFLSAADLITKRALTVQSVDIKLRVLAHDRDEVHSWAAREETCPNRHGQLLLAMKKEARALLRLFHVPLLCLNL